MQHPKPDRFSNPEHHPNPIFYRCYLKMHIKANKNAKLKAKNAQIEPGSHVMCARCSKLEAYGAVGGCLRKTQGMPMGHRETPAK